MPRKENKRRSRRMADGAYKQLFSHPDIVADLIRGYVEGPLAEALDLDSLERCIGSFVGPDLEERRADMVWRLQSRGGPVYVYLLLEFQSTVERFMAVRVMNYVALLWMELIAQKNLSPAGLLPQVLPIVLADTPGPWTAPNRLRSLISLSPDFLLRVITIIDTTLITINEIDGT